MGGTITTANTAMDGTGTVVLVYTAGANGSQLDGVHVQYTGAAVQTVLRLWINNGATNVTATNNTGPIEYTVPALAALSQVAANTVQFIPFSYNLPANYRIYATIGTSVANALKVWGRGGDL
jgi:hypothetical protein